MPSSDVSSDARPVTPLKCHMDWPQSCIERALQHYGTPEAVWRLLLAELQGRARERGLKASEITALAGRLIAEMEAVPAGDKTA